MRDLPKVLITGAGGFVCSSVMVSLLQAGWQVIAVDRQFDPTTENAIGLRWGNRVVFVRTDSTDLPHLHVDALIHGAAITASPSDLGQSTEAHLRANLDPLLAVSEWAAKHQVRRSLWISSSAVYAMTNPGEVSETQPTSPIGLYAVAKQTMESLALTLRQEYRRDISVIRLSNIYGVAEQARDTRPRVSLVGRMVKQVVETRQITVYMDDPARDWTFAPDVGAAINALLSVPTLEHSLYNIASEQLFAPIEIARVMQSLMPHIEVEVKEGCDPSTPPLTRCGYLSNKRLRQEIGFLNWTPFADGIRQAIDAQRNEATLS